MALDKIVCKYTRLTHMSPRVNLTITRTRINLKLTLLFIDVKHKLEAEVTIKTLSTLIWRSKREPCKLAKSLYGA